MPSGAGEKVKKFRTRQRESESDAGWFERQAGAVSSGGETGLGNLLKNYHGVLMYSANRNS
jgi:hypothetical protein